MDDKRSNYRPHRHLVACDYCQNYFRTLNDREVRSSVCCRSIERKLKTYTFDKLKKLANVYKIKKRKQEYITDDLVQNFENYII